MVSAKDHCNMKRSKNENFQRGNFQVLPQACVVTHQMPIFRLISLNSAAAHHLQRRLPFGGRIFDNVQNTGVQS